MISQSLRPFTEEAELSLSLDVQILSSKNRLNLDYDLQGPIQDLFIPDPISSPAFQDDLWKTTCFEVFLQWPGSQDYCEWNFSPSGAWAQYQFKTYRERHHHAPTAALKPSIAVERSETRLHMHVSIPWPETQMMNSSAELLFSMTAITHHKNNTYGYWAATHAASKPDFHDNRSFLGRIKNC